MNTPADVAEQHKLRNLQTHRKSRRRSKYEGWTPPLRLQAWEREDWEEQKTEILKAARDVVDLYEQLGKILKQKPRGRHGDNREPERAEVTQLLDEDRVKTQVLAAELQTQVTSTHPNRKALARIGHAFELLGAKVKSFAARVSDGVLDGLGKAVSENIVPILVTSLTRALKHVAELVKNIS